MSCSPAATVGSLAHSILRRANGDRVDRVVFPCDLADFADGTVHAAVISVVICWGQSEYAQGSAFESGCFACILVAEEPFDGESAAFDPDVGRL